MLLGVSHRGHRAGGVADQDGAFISPERLDVRQPVLRTRLDVVREGLIDDLETKRGELTLQPWQPDIAGGAAAVAVNQDRLGRCHGAGVSALGAPTGLPSAARKPRSMFVSE
jgi:hypothetical protein